MSNSVENGRFSFGTSHSNEAAYAIWKLCLNIDQKYSDKPIGEITERGETLLYFNFLSQLFSDHRPEVLGIQSDILMLMEQEVINKGMMVLSWDDFFWYEKYREMTITQLANLEHLSYLLEINRPLEPVLQQRSERILLDLFEQGVKESVIDRKVSMAQLGIRELDDQDNNHQQYFTFLARHETWNFRLETIKQSSGLVYELISDFNPKDLNGNKADYDIAKSALERLADL